MVHQGDGAEAQSVHLWTHKGGSAATCLPLPCRQDRSSGTGRTWRAADACCHFENWVLRNTLVYAYWCRNIYVILCVIYKATNGSIVHVRTHLHLRGVGWGWSKFMIFSLGPWMLMTSSWCVSYNSPHRGRFGWALLPCPCTRPMKLVPVSWNCCFFFMTSKQTLHPLSSFHMFFYVFLISISQL